MANQEHEVLYTRIVDGEEWLVDPWTERVEAVRAQLLVAVFESE